MNKLPVVVFALLLSMFFLMGAVLIGMDNQRHEAQVRAARNACIERDFERYRITTPEESVESMP